MNSKPWKDDGPLSDLERLAAQILSNSYARRIEAIVDGQLSGQLTPGGILLHFVEPKQFSYVVSVLEAARQIGIRDACAITVRHVDSTYGDKRVNKALKAVDEEIQALRTDRMSVAVAK